ALSVGRMRHDQPTTPVSFLRRGTSNFRGHAPDDFVPLRRGDKQLRSVRAEREVPGDYGDSLLGIPGLCQLLQDLRWQLTKVKRYAVLWIERNSRRQDRRPPYVPAFDTLAQSHGVRDDRPRVDDASEAKARQHLAEGLL